MGASLDAFCVAGKTCFHAKISHSLCSYGHDGADNLIIIKDIPLPFAAHIYRKTELVDKEF